MPKTGDGAAAQGDEQVKQDDKFFASSAIITVSVGTGKHKRIYNLHEDVLVTQCPFFEKCLRSGMKEQVEQAVNLPEDKPESFEIAVKWMYAEKVPTNIDDVRIGAAYILANKLCMAELQNALVDQFRAICRKGSFNLLSAVTWIWQQTPEGCKLREVSLDQLHFAILKSPASYKKADGFEKLKTGGKLVTEMYWKSVYQKQSANPAFLTGCVYHVHEDGKKCT